MAAVRVARGDRTIKGGRRTEPVDGLVIRAPGSVEAFDVAGEDVDAGNGIQCRSDKPGEAFTKYRLAVPTGTVSTGSERSTIGRRVPGLPSEGVHVGSMERAILASS